MKNPDIEFDSKTAYRTCSRTDIPCPVSDEDLSYYQFPLPIFVEQRIATLPKFDETELLNLFPKAKHVLSSKIDDWKQELRTSLDAMKSELVSIYKLTPSTTERWIRRELLKINYGEIINRIEQHLARLKRLQLRAKGKVCNGKINDEQIRLARSVPIENVINLKPTKHRKILSCLCPLHNEKRPSFFIYTDQNRCWCYGCNQGGDVISLVKLLYGYSFTEAVKYLTNNK
jgi:hypothetical protein